MHAGFEAVAGFPLKSGLMPVCVPTVGVVLMETVEWDTYHSLCVGERLMREVNP